MVCRAIRQGIIDLAIGSTINWSPQVRQLNLFSLPFLMPDYKAIDALTRGGVGRQVFQILDKAGVVPLAWGENGFRELSNSKGAIATPADMKGKKFRVVGSPIFIDTFTALGANPTQMSFAGSGNEALKQIEAQGVTVTHLTPAQIKAFQAASKPVYDKWAGQIGRDLVKAAEASIAKR